MVGALGSSRTVLTAKNTQLTARGRTTTGNTLRLSNENPVAPLSCIVRSSTNSDPFWSTPSPYKPQLVPDFSGLALSLWAYSKALGSPITYPEWSWISDNTSNQVIGASTATTAEAQQL